jgi:O-antigen/teichoic acid export membrane protein
LQIAAQAVLFPFVLRLLSQETTGIWAIFSTIIAFVNLLDFGFNPSFSRNVTYVLSGVMSLKETGFHIPQKDAVINYSLLKGLIKTMRMFYSCMAVILLILLLSGGTCYIDLVLRDYTGSRNEVFISWFILCAVNVWSFYTLYYDALLLGMGLVKRSRQIAVVGQLLYLVTAVILVLNGFGLIAIVSAQAISVVLRRILSYRSIYTAELKENLRCVFPQSQKDILKAIYPNAIKIGLTGIASFMVSRSAVIVGSLYLPLSTIASYGITIQIIGIIAGIAGVYFTTYQPKIVQHRVYSDTTAIKQYYLRSCFFVWTTYIVMGLLAIFLGDWVVSFLMKSQTPLMDRHFVAVALVVSLLEINHALAGNILLTKNEVPFFKAALFSGSLTLFLLFVFLGYAHIGAWGMILAPAIAQGCYQNWKWPKVVIKELQVKKYDVYTSFYSVLHQLHIFKQEVRS